MSRIFINYRRQDSESYVDRLHDHLLRHFESHDIFMDIESIEPGHDFVEVLENAVAACDVFLAVIGPQWLNLTLENGERRIDQWNDFVRIEIESALKQNKLVIPILVGQGKMPQTAQLPESIQLLARRHSIEMTRKHFAEDVDTLIEIIRKSLQPRLARKAKSSPEVVEQKAEAIAELRLKLVSATDSPLYHHRVENRYFPVLGDGHPDARIMFIGESPGKMEVERGQVFIGQSGKVLDELLEGINLLRSDVFITNAILDTPTSKRDPLPEELAFYEPFVNQLIDIVQPRLIATMGQFATGYILKKLDLPEKRGRIGQLHGKPIKTQFEYGEVFIVPLYHPAVVLYSSSQKTILQQDFATLKMFL